ncbi:MAG: HAD-IA family hydrolase [Candidatus Babeliales bacterium]
MKCKKLFIITIVFLLAFIFYSNNFKSEIPPAKINSIQYADPTQTIILWDLHGVVFAQKLSTAMGIVWGYNRKFEILQHLNIPLVKLMGNFLLQLLRLTSQEVTSEELIATARNAHNNPLIELALQISSAYHPIKGVVEIIKELNSLGYQQDIGSNIGETSFYVFKKKYPTIFYYFNHEHIVRYRPGKKIIKKPNKEYFLNYLYDYNLNADQVIFIDDKIANVQAARAVGMHAIHFKNPGKFRTDLQNLGISLALSKTSSIEQYD